MCFSFNYQFRFNSNHDYNNPFGRNRSSPIMNVINRSSQVNFGIQWVHRSPSVSSMITENYFRINIGLTFSESWFMKWKFQ